MLSYNDLGTGTPIVLIHGLGSKKEAWIPQHELANRYRLIIPDLRGHGETIMNEDLTIKNFALDIINLLEYLKISSAFICGLSLGGIVAQELYKQRPEIVRGLILSNTTSYIPFFLANGIIHLSNQLLQTDQQKLIDQIVKAALYDNSYQKEARKAFHIRDTYIKSAKAPIGINYYSFLPFIKKPVLLIGSTHDKVTPSINIYLMKLFIRDARLSIFRNTGHLSNIEKKDLFNKHLHDFIMTTA
ncbi:MULTISPECIES: alpha/beta fold hydrolase [Metabacillus]|jgi:pimeloyl-ACP methyl ester carboxylesterase|uniref:Alpha/beta hydrolase n=1 Tax=Metabacillus rhizolycopersici TaxID=2875709 RepID=A0ABS7UUP7_9BACI|nr:MULTISPECIES: alpha/beta hydrolase [Metabacillus]MBZ5751644.1 alpha/beta hydrolase [Metabacillus rhizolycopersici]MCM3651887.1 alpha/beta hydrolase [Metabacillus litoralis]